MQRVLIILGLVLLTVGVLWPLLRNIGWGHLPGDFSATNNNFKFYLPLTTSLIVSIIATLIFWLLRK